ncbi:hypothetical protein ACJW31_11G040900 [Castanea mollissima]
MSSVTFFINNWKRVGPPSVSGHIILPLEAFVVPNALTSVMASVFLSYLYFFDFSIYSYSSINTSHPPLPTYHYFKLLSFLLLLRPLTCSIFSQATLNPTQTERKKKESQLKTSTPQHIRY